jgi:flavin-dependent thymidylate synthase
MNVELIDYTGMGQSDPMWAAKKLIYIKNTRLNRSPEERAKIMALEGEELSTALFGMVQSIRSSWEFVSWTFEVTGISRACADQILRTRHGSYAVQAMRVVDMGSFETVVPPSVKQNPEAMRIWKLVMGQIAYAYRSLQSLDIPNQDCRGVIPMNACTNFNAEWNLRTFSDICGKRDNLRAQGEYTEFVIKLREKVYAVMPWVKGFVEPERTATPALQKIMSSQLGLAGPLDKPLVNEALKEIDMLKGVWG